MADRRLFFALWPSDRQREVLRETIRPLLNSIEGAATDRRNWHVTLVFIGAFPEWRIPALQEAMAGIQCEPFRLRFDRANFWARPKIACLQTARVPDELLALVKDINKAIQPFEIPPEEHSFNPHITIARKARSFESQLLARPVDLQWSDFELVESISDPRGVQYRPLKQ